jgi:hypothetical protein
MLKLCLSVDGKLVNTHLVSLKRVAIMAIDVVKVGFEYFEAILQLISCKSFSVFSLPLGEFLLARGLGVN